MRAYTPHMNALASKTLAMLSAISIACGQHAVAHSDELVDRLHSSNPFYGRRALNATQIDELVARTASVTDAQRRADGHEACGLDIALAWTTKLGASVYATPLLVPGRAVWASTFVRFAEAVDGVDGHERPGWPYAFASSTFHTSPLSFDVDADGINEMLLINFEGEVVFLSERGLPMRGRGFKLPKLRVRKNWYEGLHDVHTMPFKRVGHGLVHHATEEQDESDDSAYAGPDASAAGTAAAAAAHWADDAAPQDIGPHGGLSAEAEASFGLLFAHEQGDDEAELFEEEGARVGAAAEDDEPRLRRWASAYEDGQTLRRLDESGYLYVDAHVLSTPTLSDIDGDGALDLLVAASYFIEAASAARLARHGVIIERDKYVAGGVLALDPRTGAVKWSVHLDLTTELTKLRACAAVHSRSHRSCGASSRLCPRPSPPACLSPRSCCDSPLTARLGPTFCSPSPSHRHLHTGERGGSRRRRHTRGGCGNVHGLPLRSLGGGRQAA